MASDEFDSVGAKIFALIHRLKVCQAPTALWTAVKTIQGSQMSAVQLQVHTLFASALIDISAAVGHSAGNERAGKVYKRIHSSIRSSLLGAKLEKAAYILNNYNLIHSEAMPTSNLTDFAHGFLSDDEKEVLTAAEALERQQPVLEDGSASESSEPEHEPEAPDEPEETFSIPHGFTQQSRPDLLDGTLVGMYVYSLFTMDNKRRGGLRRTWTEWFMGKVARHLDASSAPSLHRRYNYDVMYDGEGTRGVMLKLADYKSDLTDVGHPAGTWVLLAEKA